VTFENVWEPAKPQLMEIWNQVQDQDDAILIVWMEEDQLELERLQNTEIDLKDITLGRQKDIYMHQLVTSMHSMSLEERQRMRDKLRKLDEEGATEHDSHN
jgi:hypothetical protein